MYYTNEDFEQFFIRYKAEGLPAKETLQGFCSRNKVPYNLYSDMTREEIIRLSMLQREMLDKAEREKAEKERQNKELLSKADELLASQAKTQTAFNEMAEAMAEQVAENKRLNEIIADLTEQLKLTNKERFGSKSQKGVPKSKSEHKVTDQ